MDTFLTVRVGMLPGQILTVALNGSRTVAAAAAAAQLNVTGYEARVNNSTVGLDHVLQNGDTVLFVKPVKGN